MHRRDFLKFQAAAALSIGAAALALPNRVLADASPDIAVVKGAPAAATRAAVELLGGMSAFIKPGQKVVIKPNMSFTADVASATNTHPEVVRELLVMCMEAGAGTVRILDHAFQSGTPPLELPLRAFLMRMPYAHGIGRSGQATRQPRGNGFSKPLPALWRMHESLSHRRLAADLVSGRFFRDVHAIS